MTFDDLLTVTRRRIVELTVVVAVCTLLALMASMLAPATYTATAVAYVQVTAEPTENQSATEAYNTASQLAAKKVPAIVPVFSSASVAQDVVDELGLHRSASAVAASIRAQYTTDELSITVLASAPSAQEARQIADAAVRHTNAEVKRLDGEASPVEVVLMSSADSAGVSREPSRARYLLVGFLAGLVIAYLMVLARELLDRSVHSARDLAAAVRGDVLGVLPASRVISLASGLLAADQVSAEAYRALRTNLRQASVGAGRGGVVVTSPRHGEGRTTISLNLARVLALAGQNVILVEGDLRRPVLTQALGQQGKRPGLTHYLSGSSSLDAVIAPTSTRGLSVITAGTVPANPSEVLGSSRMQELMERLTSRALVVIDSPPVLEATDGVVLAEYVQGVLLVAQSGRTSRDDLAAAGEALERGGAALVGTVLNRDSQSWVDRPWLRGSADGRVRFRATSSVSGRASAPTGRTTAPAPQDAPAQATG